MPRTKRPRLFAFLLAFLLVSVNVADAFQPVYGRKAMVVTEELFATDVPVSPC